MPKRAIDQEAAQFGAEPLPVPLQEVVRELRHHVDVVEPVADHLLEQVGHDEVVALGDGLEHELVDVVVEVEHLLVVRLPTDRTPRAGCRAAARRRGALRHHGRGLGWDGPAAASRDDDRSARKGLEGDGSKRRLGASAAPGGAGFDRGARARLGLGGRPRPPRAPGARFGVGLDGPGRGLAGVTGASVPRNADDGRLPRCPDVPQPPSASARMANSECRRPHAGSHQHRSSLLDLSSVSQADVPEPHPNECSPKEQVFATPDGFFPSPVSVMSQ